MGLLDRLPPPSEEDAEVEAPAPDWPPAPAAEADADPPPPLPLLLPFFLLLLLLLFLLFLWLLLLLLLYWLLPADPERLCCCAPSPLSFFPGIKVLSTASRRDRYVPRSLHAGVSNLLSMMALFQRVLRPSKKRRLASSDDTS